MGAVRKGQQLSGGDLLGSVARRVKGGTVVPFSTAFVCERCHHDRFIGSVTVTKSP
jgi:hypothetical protein